MFRNLGRVQDAERLFDRMEERDTISRNAMISMYSHEGACSKCFLILSDMHHSGARPDVTTLCSLVSVCALFDHVSYGTGIHSLCIRTGHHSALPVINALVNMYSSAGKLDDAEILFWNMSTRDIISWNTTISAYVQNDNCIDAMKTASQLLQTEDAVPGKIFAEKIYAKLDEILLKLREIGYIADTSSALHDTDEEQKEQNLWNHSEKLVLAYGLTIVPEGSTIRIFKNLRVCADCHFVLKLVSMVFHREIVLRDPYRFNQFKGGSCTCSDFW